LVRLDLLNAPFVFGGLLADQRSPLGKLVANLASDCRHVRGRDSHAWVERRDGALDLNDGVVAG
jgi:hypothetical protein